MPRYIDAIEAKAAIKDLFADMPRIDFMDNRDRWRKENEQYLRCLDVISSLPTADVVQVVRCKYCFYGIPYNEKWTLPKKNNCMWCKRYEDVRIPEWFCADGFCADGERRDDAEVH